MGQERLDYPDRLGISSSGVNEDLRVGTRRQHQLVESCSMDGLDRGGMMSVGRVEEGDHDAGVEENYRHSRRSFWRAFFE